MVGSVARLYSVHDKVVDQGNVHFTFLTLLSIPGAVGHGRPPPTPVRLPLSTAKTGHPRWNVDPQLSRGDPSPIPWVSRATNGESGSAGNVSPDLLPTLLNPSAECSSITVFGMDTCLSTSNIGMRRENCLFLRPGLFNFFKCTPECRSSTVPVLILSPEPRLGKGEQEKTSYNRHFKLKIFGWLNHRMKPRSVVNEIFSFNVNWLIFTLFVFAVIK